MLLEAWLFGAFGLIVGSFLNVVILREGTDRSLGGRSECASCHTTLKWRDLVPVFSWIALYGKCRRCGERIPLQYPVVELAAGILFAMVGFAAIPVVLKILGVLVVSLYIAITVYDLYHTLIPDLWSYAAALLAFLYALYALYAETGTYTGFEGDASIWYLVLAGPAAALPLFSLWFLSRGRWMGLGDVKLALSIGWLLGPWLGLFAILGAFVLGSIVSVCILLPIQHIGSFVRRLGITIFHSRGGGFTMQSEVPFGPFLVWSTLVVWLLAVHGYDPFAFLF